MWHCAQHLCVNCVLELCRLLDLLSGVLVCVIARNPVVKRLSVVEHSDWLSCVLARDDVSCVYCRQTQRSLIKLSSFLHRWRKL